MSQILTSLQYIINTTRPIINTHIKKVVSDVNSVSTTTKIVIGTTFITSFVLGKKSNSTVKNLHNLND